jgi:hypothetical protein
MSILIEDDKHCVQDLQFVKTRLAHKIHECDRLEGEAGRLKQQLRLQEKIIGSLRFEKSALQDQKGELELCILELKEQMTLCVAVDRASKLADDLQVICREQKRQRI